MRFLFLFLFLLIAVPSIGVSQPVEVQVSIRVDTSEVVQHELYTLWKNYLNSRPDSLYNNPYWSDIDKNRYPVFDVGGRFIYSVVTGQVRMWKPHLLTIEPYGDGYELRTAYLSLDTTYPEQHLWAVQRVHAIKESGGWKLLSPMQAINAHNQHFVIEEFEFILPQGLGFNKELAHRNIEFADSIVKSFELRPQKHIEFYVARNRDELCDMIGLPLLLPASGGFAFSENRQLFTSTGEPWYPHELVHVLFLEYSKTMHGIINEGIATYLAGASHLTPSYSESFSVAQTAFAKGEVGLDYVLENQYINGTKDIYYGTGAWLTEQVLEKAGVQGLKQIMLAGQSSGKLRNALERVLERSWEEIQIQWKLAIAKK